MDTYVFSLMVAVDRDGTQWQTICLVFLFFYYPYHYQPFTFPVQWGQCWWNKTYNFFSNQCLHLVFTEQVFLLLQRGDFSSFVTRDMSYNVISVKNRKCNFPLFHMTELCVLCHSKFSLELVFLMFVHSKMPPIFSQTKQIFFNMIQL